MVYAREYHSPIQKEILPFATTQMDLEGILPSEVSQTEKDQYYMISLICGISQKQKNRTRNKNSEENRSDFLHRREICLPGLFTIQTFFKRYSETMAATTYVETSQELLFYMKN